MKQKENIGVKTKILGLLLTLAVAVTSLPTGTTAYAAESEATEVQQERSAESLGVTEAEIKASAVALTSGVAKMDSIAEYKAVNWYKFTVPKTGGYVNYSLSKINADSDGMWSIEWYFENVTDGQFWKTTFNTQCFRYSCHGVRTQIIIQNSPFGRYESSLLGDMLIVSGGVYETTLVEV